MAFGSPLGGFDLDMGDFDDLDLDFITEPSTPSQQSLSPSSSNYEELTDSSPSQRCSSPASSTSSGSPVGSHLDSSYESSARRAPRESIKHDARNGTAERAERRRLQNREAARRCRDKTKSRITELEVVVAQLEEEKLVLCARVKDLEHANWELQQENNQLKGISPSHSNAVGVAVEQARILERQLTEAKDALEVFRPLDLGTSQFAHRTSRPRQGRGRVHEHSSPPSSPLPAPFVPVAARPFFPQYNVGDEAYPAPQVQYAPQFQPPNGPAFQPQPIPDVQFEQLLLQAQQLAAQLAQQPAPAVADAQHFPVQQDGQNQGAHAQLVHFMQQHAPDGEPVQNQPPGVLPGDEDVFMGQQGRQGPLRHAEGVLYIQDDAFVQDGVQHQPLQPDQHAPPYPVADQPNNDIQLPAMLELQNQHVPPNPAGPMQPLPGGGGQPPQELQLHAVGNRQNQPFQVGAVNQPNEPFLLQGDLLHQDGGLRPDLGLHPDGGLRPQHLPQPQQHQAGGQDGVGQQFQDNNQHFALQQQHQVVVGQPFQDNQRFVRPQHQDGGAGIAVGDRGGDVFRGGDGVHGGAWRIPVQDENQNRPLQDDGGGAVWQAVQYQADGRLQGGRGGGAVDGGQLPPAAEGELLQQRQFRQQAREDGEDPGEMQLLQERVRAQHGLDGQQAALALEAGAEAGAVFDRRRLEEQRLQLQIGLRPDGQLFQRHDRNGQDPQNIGPLMFQQNAPQQPQPGRAEGAQRGWEQERFEGARELQANLQSDTGNKQDPGKKQKQSLDPDTGKTDDLDPSFGGAQFQMFQLFQVLLYLVASQDPEQVVAVKRAFPGQLTGQRMQTLFRKFVSLSASSIDRVFSIAGEEQSTLMQSDCDMRKLQQLQQVPSQFRLMQSEQNFDTRKLQQLQQERTLMRKNCDMRKLQQLQQAPSQFRPGFPQAALQQSQGQLGQPPELDRQQGLRNAQFLLPPKHAVAPSIGEFCKLQANQAQFPDQSRAQLLAQWHLDSQFDSQFPSESLSQRTQLPRRLQQQQQQVQQKGFKARLRLQSQGQRSPLQLDPNQAPIANQEPQQQQQVQKKDFQARLQNQKDQTFLLHSQSQRNQFQLDLTQTPIVQGTLATGLQVQPFRTTETAQFLFSNCFDCFRVFFRKYDRFISSAGQAFCPAVPEPQAGGELKTKALQALVFADTPGTADYFDTQESDNSPEALVTDSLQSKADFLRSNGGCSNPTPDSPAMQILVLFVVDLLGLCFNGKVFSIGEGCPAAAGSLWLLTALAGRTQTGRTQATACSDLIGAEVEFALGSHCHCKAEVDIARSPSVSIPLEVL